MSMQDYVERVVQAGFDRELEQNENVMRSLPFFATSLGVLATVLGFLRATLCPPARAVLPVLIWLALGGLVLSVAGSLGFLYRALASRGYAYPMRESDLIGYAAAVAEASRAAAPHPRAPDAVEAAALAELRATRIQQLAEAAELNRRQNAGRLRARGLALIALLTAIAFAFLLITLIVTQDIFAPGACHGGSQEDRAASDTDAPGAGGLPGAAARAPDARRGPGRLGLARAGAPG